MSKVHFKKLEAKINHRVCYDPFGTRLVHFERLRNKYNNSRKKIVTYDLILK